MAKLAFFDDVPADAELIFCIANHNHLIGKRDAADFAKLVMVDADLVHGTP